MTIKRICDKCGKEDEKAGKVQGSDGTLYDACRKCGLEYDKLMNSCLAERNAKLDAWLKGK